MYSKAHILVPGLDHTDLFEKEVDGFITLKSKFISKNDIRGLWLNAAKDTIIARGFNRFYNYGEIREENSLEVLKNKFKFPLEVFKKENGFLLLCSYYKGELLFFTKNDTNSQYTTWGKELLEEHFALLETFFSTNPNTTLLFEVIRIEDPHIVECKENSIILLDCIKNQPLMEKVSYEYLKNFFQGEILVKTHYATLTDINQFIDFSVEAAAMVDIEGFIVEDTTGYTLKVKTDWYFELKYIRGLIPKLKNSKTNIKKYRKPTPAFTKKLNWIKTHLAEIEEDFSIPDLVQKMKLEDQP